MLSSKWRRDAEKGEFPFWIKGIHGGRLHRQERTVRVVISAE